MAAGFSETQADFLLANGVPHVHGPETIYVDEKRTTDLDEWSNSVEERLDDEEVEEDADEDDNT